MQKKTTMPDLYQLEKETMLEYVREHVKWSEETFGKGERTEGLLKHIEKEIQEAREADFYIGIAPEAGDCLKMELVDIIILALDATWRLGFTPEQIISALIEKQNINKAREWPQETRPNQPTEHIRQKE